MCTEFHPSIICLSETHLCDDATDSLCPPGYVVAARQDRSKHGGDVLIISHEVILLEEINTTVFSIVEKAELVAIHVQSFTIVCCYRQPSSVDVTLLYNLDHLLDKHSSLSLGILMSTNPPPAILQVLVQQHWTFVNPEVYINWLIFQLVLMPFWILS